MSKEKSRAVFRFHDAVWYRSESVPRCTESVFVQYPCQGPAGHPGAHWCYANDGCYLWSENAAEVDATDEYRIAAGQTPPGHPDYVDPVVGYERKGPYLTDPVPVTDPEEVARLNAGKVRPGESLVRPVDGTNEE